MEGIERALNFCLNHEHYILTTHDNPDADGLGAELLLLAALEKAGKTARIINSDTKSSLLDFLDPVGKTARRPDDPIPTAAGAALIVIDSSDPKHLGELGLQLLKTAASVFFIDHHDNTHINPLTAWVEVTASSSSEMITRLVTRLGLELTPALATAAYAGIVFDSGFFAYPKTTAATFRAALSLVEAGAVPAQVYRALRENSPLRALLLQQRVIASLRISFNGKVAFLSMKQQDLVDCGADFEDTENLVNWPLSCREIEVSAFIKETPEGLCRCSLRSKGAIDVAKLAQSFGGGGHRTAAGFRCRRGPKFTTAEIIRALDGLFANDSEEAKS